MVAEGWDDAGHNSSLLLGVVVVGFDDVSLELEMVLEELLFYHFQVIPLLSSPLEHRHSRP